MPFKQFKPQVTHHDGSVRLGRCSVHPQSLVATCNGACTPTGGIEDETTVRLSEEQLPSITSVNRRTHQPDWLSRATSFLRVQGPMMVTGVVLGFSFFTMARMPLGSSNVSVKAGPRPVAAAAAIDPAPALALPPPPPPAAWQPAIDTIERTPAARALAHHRKKAKHGDRAACDPPYRFDADGIKRLKPRCL